jgi:tRNA-specific 2-thiouridylase
MNKVAVAMSGGVDSSVAAALCVEKYGKDNVFGVTMRLFCYGEAEADEKSCCSLEAVNDAKHVCDQLGIAHYALNFEKEFEFAVINDFVKEYQEGHTPNPCVRCNQVIKFENLLERVKTLGADLLVTGHYARMAEKDGVFQLLKGLDNTKDQSYFLYNLNQEQLAHVDFPLGGMEKTETRKAAAKLNLKTAEKTESQDICFVSSSIREFLEPRVRFEKGNILTREGNIAGTHEGLPFYTIGQRKGLGGGFEQPMYVTGVNVEKNELIVGPEEELFSNELIIESPHWIACDEILPFKCTAKIRYAAEEAECEVAESKSGIVVKFNEPQKAITPGQSCVFYQGEVVLGGGTIK